MVLPTGSQLIDDIRKAPDDVLSLSEPMREVCWCQCGTVTSYSYGLSSCFNQNIRRTYWTTMMNITQKLFVPEYCKYFQGGPRRAYHGYGRSDPGTGRQCVAMSRSKRLYLTQHAEWVKVSILDTLQRVVCRATNRVFVGVPLCSYFIF
jgi:hypothetical protein